MIIFFIFLWPNNQLYQLNDFLQFINILYPSNQFTLEVGGSFNTSSQTKKHIIFSIFRKPTHTDLAHNIIGHIAVQNFL